jgi:hypothetical protein
MLNEASIHAEVAEQEAVAKRSIEGHQAVLRRKSSVRCLDQGARVTVSITCYTHDRLEVHTSPFQGKQHVLAMDTPTWARG